jgi:hypothetical protein
MATLSSQLQKDCEIDAMAEIRAVNQNKRLCKTDAMAESC